ncbi:hypothetical protein [Nonomuraea sp. NPDC049400]|uniref:hypothetical protein n=1 Tax=Nonomuraea sp. NPDC049400 TaxID=3364352 RepID=UPI0037A4EFFB
MIPPTAPRAAASLSGLLAFPVTPFTASGDVDLPRLKGHLADVPAAKPSAIFVACGTGEPASLTGAESARAAQAAGPVRAPLAELTPEHREQLARIIDRGLAALGATPVA